ncbi:MAG: SDR family NAD(P)-dependent oxidoreductase, partial [Proteobacteria bacterium]
MKNIFIIGATSSIAQAVARRYASQGCNFVLAGRDESHLASIAEDLKIRGAKSAHIITCDFNEFTVHANLVATAWKKLENRIDVALFAHGYLGAQQIAQTEQVELLKIISTNFVSHVSILNELSQRMEVARTGTIAIITSVAGERGRKSNYIYGASMAAKTTFGDGLRNRLFESGVNVVNLKLGFVDTPMTKQFPKGPLWATPQKAGHCIVNAIERGNSTAY